MRISVSAFSHSFIKIVTEHLPYTRNHSREWGYSSEEKKGVPSWSLYSSSGRRQKRTHECRMSGCQVRRKWSQAKDLEVMGWCYFRWGVRKRPPCCGDIWAETWKKKTHEPCSDWGKKIPGRGNSTYKGLRVGGCLMCLRDVEDASMKYT